MVELRQCENRKRELSSHKLCSLTIAVVVILGVIFGFMVHFTTSSSKLHILLTIRELYLGERSGTLRVASRKASEECGAVS
jgi:hypothetical protein